MTRTEPVVNCPVCGGQNSIRNRLDPSVPETKNCTFCNSIGRVPRSVATDWEMARYEEFKRGKGGKR